MNKIINSKSIIIQKAIKNLPYFTINDLFPIEKNKNYLKVLFYRLAKREIIIPLKRGMYVSKEYIEKANRMNFINGYLEFIGTTIYQPSYLSLEYVLEKYAIISESVNTITLVVSKKTKRFFNSLGVFNYYKINDKLFNGFEIKRKDHLMIAEATLAKALFDYLYIRKNIIYSKKQFKELRLNLDNFSKNDYREFKKYVKLEKTKKMKEIYKYLVEAK